MTSEDRPLTRLRELPTWLVSQVAGQGHRLLSERLAAAGTRGYDTRLLAALLEHGPASQAELGRRTGIDRSDVVASLNDLAAAGLVERSPDPGDRRRNIVTVTEDGRRAFAGFARIIDGVQDDLLSPLSAAERAELIRLLSALNEHHGAKAPWQGAGE
ncbi:MarR family winged helix-turn-helix transcriptional regulator [Actinomadura parmotrematis]|uniref:MarR family transcriptional regulator n=1 Tax=Actinomadura parmotrematis TaxID=2864039 RepID=A0ABS7FT53_9ACTN|nr:MarR family transcriptional regulator [Actinomadura parmotrematis]MBW8482723.1 MarR family transcriptional regulator [Actinomadura parmotrematis]